MSDNDTDRLLSDDGLLEELGNIVIREGARLNPNGSFLQSAVDLINTQKRLYAESVIGEDTPYDARGKYPVEIEVENELRAEQRARIK